MPEMTDEQRAAFIDAAGPALMPRTNPAHPHVRTQAAKALDALTEAGFTITLDAVRDHTGQSVVWEVESD